MFETITIGTRGGEQLLADLYLPQPAQGPVPLIVAASGGGWRRGDRQALGQWGSHFSRQGIAFASVDYARATDGPAWPQNAQDVAAALAYFGNKGADHGIDPARIGALGVSAGAHLTALALLSDAFDTPQVLCFAGIYGVYDLMAHWQHDLVVHARPSDDLTARMIGCTPYEDPQRYHDASPLRQITYKAAMPVFLSWGHLDREVCPSQSADFAAALRQAGFPVRCREFDDAGHFWFSEDSLNAPVTAAARLAPDLTQFFRRALLPKDRAAAAPAIAAARAIG